MSCCGRARVATALPATPRPAADSATPPAAHPAPRVSFSYEGPTRLQAVGPITQQRYRFEHTGAVVAVDARDAPSLAAIPHLRRLRMAAG